MVKRKSILCKTKEEMAILLDKRGPLQIKCLGTTGKGMSHSPSFIGEQRLEQAILNSKRIKRVVFIGAHPDDIELGAGATVVKMIHLGYWIKFVCVTSDGKRIKEARESAKFLGAHIFEPLGFLDKEVPSSGKEFVRLVQALEKEIGSADIVFTHFPHVSHQDHYAVFKATMAAARNVGTVLCYEPFLERTTDFAPNVFVDISGFLVHKTRAFALHKSQVKKYGDLYSEISAMANFRGYQSGCRQAEAFYLERMKWEL